jgi:hypothetical protein
LEEEAHDSILLMEFFCRFLEPLSWRQESTPAREFVRPDPKGRRGKMNRQAYDRWYNACLIQVSSFTLPTPAPATSETFANLNLVLRDVPERRNELRATCVDRVPQTDTAARTHGKAAMGREPPLRAASVAGLLLSWEDIHSIIVTSVSIEIPGTQNAN